MASISSCRDFDNALIWQLTKIQYQMDSGIPGGMLTALNAFQREQQLSQSFLTPPYVQTTELLNRLKSAWQAPQLHTALTTAQHLFDSRPPELQAVIHQQYQAIVPQIEAPMLELIRSSSGLSRDMRISALSSALDAFASVGVPAYDPPAAGLTDEESAQLALEISEAVEDRQNWQQRLTDIIQNWKAHNPVAAFIVQTVVTALISQLISSLLSWGASALRDASIREQPNSRAAVVCQVKQGETITVVGDAPYYYLVEFDSPDANELISGYISKKSVKPAQDDDD